jgi:kinesin family protein 2/24
VYQPKTRVDLTKEVETISFAFDNVYDENSTNTQIYNETIRALIPGLFEGRWASVFAYGQTGSGKT